MIFSEIKKLADWSYQYYSKEFQYPYLFLYHKKLNIALMMVNLQIDNIKLITSLQPVDVKLILGLQLINIELIINLWSKALKLRIWNTSMNIRKKKKILYLFNYLWHKKFKRLI